MIVLFVIINLIGIPLTVILIGYVFSLFDIIVTQGPRKGRIMLVMHSEDPYVYIGNLDGYWVHPKTGEIFDSITNPKPADLELPETIQILGWDTGIYWLGLPPVAHRYEYKFDWNQWAKEHRPDGTTSQDYAVIPRSEVVGSLFHIAQYPIQTTGAETSEGVPMDSTTLITVQIVHSGLALFRASSPGWLSSVSGHCVGLQGDFNRQRTVDDMFKLQTEMPTGGSTKTEYQARFDALNTSTVGNPSLAELYGVKIIAVSLVQLEIGAAVNDGQKAAITEYYAKQARKVAEIEADARFANSVKDRATAENKTRSEAFDLEQKGLAQARITETQGEVEARLIEKRGNALAAAAKKMADAVSRNPHAGALALAEAIQKQNHATTLILGQGVLPTKVI